MKNIEILYSTDVNGIDLLKVSLYSLLKNKNNQTFYNITIAHKNIDTNIINQIHKIIDYFTNVTIRFIDCLVQDQQYGLSNISKAEKNPIKLEWPSPMYYFFLAPNYYSPDVKKVIYIDIDTVVQKDLTDVWQFFTTAIFTGTKCTTIFPYIQYQNQMNALGKLDEVAFKYSEFLDTDLTKYQNYLNSGVLIINLDKLRTVDLNDLFNVAKLHYFGDQDLICYYFEKDIVNFPIKYNFCIHFFIDQIYIKQLSINQITINDLNNYQNFAYILHITARWKPTKFFNDELLNIIKKCGGVTKYIDVISLTDKKLAEYNIELSSKEYKKIHDLSKGWIQFIYGLTQKTRLYERVFYQWALIWEEMINLNLIF